MAKEILEKELVLFDYIKKKFLFFHIKVTSVGYNEVQISMIEGKLGNRGREQIIRFEKDKNALKNAMKIAYKHIYDKKADGYISIAKISLAINSIQQKEKNEKKKRMEKEKASFQCDLCEKPIKPEIYKKIDEWARAGGNWDFDDQFIGFKKVLCLDCQIEHDIFKKKVKK
jgi:hypothetical protein